MSVDTPDPGRTTAVSEQQALAGVLRIADAPEGSASVQGIEDLFMARAYRVSGRTLEAAVDVNTGRIIHVSMVDRMPSSSRATINEGVALQRAEAFLTAKGIDTNGLHPEVRFLDHGSSAEYIVTWSRREAGVLVPDRRIVQVNPLTAEVFAVSDLRREYAAPTTPKLSQSDAESIARKDAGVSGRLAVAELVVAFDRAGRQILVWQLQFVDGADDPTAYVQASYVSVDAADGSIVEGFASP